MKSKPILKIITISIVVIVLVLTFVPINPWSTPPKDGPATYNFYSYFYFMTGLPRARPDLFVAAIGFYLFSLVSLVLVFVNKRMLFEISLMLAAGCMIPFALPICFTMYFGIAVVVSYIVVFIINLVYDKKTKALEE